MSTALPNPTRCQWCGSFHQAKCPLVKSLEYDGAMLKKVEFFTPNDVEATKEIERLENELTELNGHFEGIQRKNWKLEAEIERLKTENEQLRVALDVGTQQREDRR